MDPNPQSKQTLTIKSPAKINRCLRIIDQRPDGYHRLQSLFQLIDWHDTLTLENQHDTNAIQVMGMGIGDIPTEDNLIYKAAKRLQTYSPTPTGVTIRIQKNLPMSAGLGGGSSNAAYTLLALNQLWQLELPTKKLTELGQSLGADVPFFLSSATAWVEGIGEIITPITLNKPEVFLLIFPNCPVNTAQVFQHPDLPRKHSPVPTPIPFSTIDPHQYRENHCAQLVRKGFPTIDQCFQHIENQHPELQPQLTGTGGTLFLTFPVEEIERARDIEQSLKLAWPHYIFHLARSLLHLPEYRFA